MSGGLVVRVVDGPDCSATAALAGPVVVGRAGDLALTDPTTSRQPSPPRADW